MNMAEDRVISFSAEFEELETGIKENNDQLKRLESRSNENDEALAELKDMLA